MKNKAIVVISTIMLHLWGMMVLPAQSDSCQSKIKFRTVMGAKFFLPRNVGGGVAFDNFSVGVAPCLGIVAEYKKWGLDTRANIWAFMSAKGIDRYNAQFGGITNTYYLGVSRQFKFKNGKNIRAGLSHYWFRQNPFVYIEPELGVYKGITPHVSFPFKWVDVELWYYIHYKGIFGLFDRDNIGIYLSHKF